MRADDPTVDVVRDLPRSGVAHAAEAEPLQERSQSPLLTQALFKNN